MHGKQELSFILILCARIIVELFCYNQNGNKTVDHCGHLFYVRFLLQCGVVFAQIKNFVINTKSYQEKTALQLTRSLF